MLKFKLAIRFRSLLESSMSHNCCWDPCIPLLFFVQSKGYSSTPPPKSRDFVLAEYLTDSLKFPKSKADAISRRFPSINSSEKPKAVVQFFKTLSISDAQIRSRLQLQPHILFIDVEENIKPKIAFYQDLGLCGPRLGMLISKNPCILVGNLETNLKPSIEVMKEALEVNGSQNSSNNISDLLFRILSSLLRKLVLQPEGGNCHEMIGPNNKQGQTPQSCPAPVAAHHLAASNKSNGLTVTQLVELK